MLIRFLVVGLTIVLPFNLYANGPLRSIVVFGNEKTERQTILDIVNLESQTYVTERLVREVDDRLVNSGLFKTVHVTQTDNRDGTVDLRIVVTEKQLWFAFPIFQAWNGRYSGGAAFGESNLFVPNARTLIAIQGGNKLNRFFYVFDAKNVFGSSFSMRTWLLGRTDDVPLYQGKDKVDEIHMKDAAIALIPGYQWTNDIRTSLSFNYRYVDYGDSSFVALSGEHGNDVSIKFEFTYDSLKRREAFLKGSSLRAGYEFAESRFGTDFSYHIEEVEWTSAFVISNFVNYVISLEGAIADKILPFHRDLTLGGASLRGYSERQFRGDTRVTGRQDLLFPAYRHSKFSVFGLVFYDMGLIYRDTSGISRSAFRNGTGGGLRVSLTGILAPVFGLDFAYGIEDRKFQTYFALGLVEF